MNTDQDKNFLREFHELTRIKTGRNQFAKISVIRVKPFFHPCSSVSIRG
jgi:hypothetical protein